MSVNLIQDASVTTGSIDIKFAVTIDIDTLINSNFTLLLDGATPSPVSSPFETISVARDYDSISRIIRLYLISALTPETDYILRISNLKTPFNETLTTSSFYFTTGEDTTIDITDQVPETPEVIVEDNSIRSITAVDLTSTLVSPNATELQIMSIDPDSDTAYFLDSSYNEGRIEIVFNTILAANFVSTDYFKVQRKPVGRGMSRWEDLSVIVTSDSTSGIVIIYLPSTDATPVYGEPDVTYWEAGYKYRLRISGSIGSATDTLFIPYT